MSAHTFSRTVVVRAAFSLLGVIAIVFTLLHSELSEIPRTWLPGFSSQTIAQTWLSQGVRPSDEHAVDAPVSSDGDRNSVKLEVHIMSKCPDARDCLELLVLPALEELGPDIVEFRMSFIGRLVNLML